MNGANKGEPPVHQEIVDRDPELKRVRTLSGKALENAVEEKHREIACVHKLLKETMQSAKELSKGSNFEIILRDLRGLSEELKMKIDELQNLYTQDKNKYLGDEEPLLTSESLTLDQAYKLVEEIKSRQSDNLLETRSRLSYQSSRSKVSSRASTTSSAARMESTRRSSSSTRERRIRKVYHRNGTRAQETRSRDRANTRTGASKSPKGAGVSHR